MISFVIMQFSWLKNGQASSLLNYYICALCWTSVFLWDKVWWQFRAIVYPNGSHTDCGAIPDRSASPGPFGFIHEAKKMCNQLTSVADRWGPGQRSRHALVLLPMTFDPKDLKGKVKSPMLGTKRNKDNIHNHFLEYRHLDWPIHQAF